MLAKIISVTSLVFAIGLFLLALSVPSDSLFFIVSGGEVVPILRLLIAAGAVWVIFLLAPLKRVSESRLQSLGLMMLLTGIVGFAVNSGGYILYDYVKPLDFMLISQLGAAMTLSALEQPKPAAAGAKAAIRKTKPAAGPKLALQS